MLHAEEQTLHSVLVAVPAVAGRDGRHVRYQWYAVRSVRAARWPPLRPPSAAQEGDDDRKCMHRNQLLLGGTSTGAASPRVSSNVPLARSANGCSKSQ